MVAARAHHSFIFVRVYLTHRRIRIARASTAEYLVVSAEGLRVAGHVTVPWSVVGGGLGVDARNEVQPAYRAFAVGVEQYAGVMQAEFALSVRGVRSLRDAAPRDLPLGGTDSLGSMPGWIAGGLSGVAFAGAYLLPGGGSSQPSLAWRHEVPLAKRIIDLIALTLATAMFNYQPRPDHHGLRHHGARGIRLRYIPDLPKDLIAFTTVVVIGIIVSVLLWVPIGYYNLTGMELIAAGLLFAWLLVFVRSAEAYGAGPARAPVADPSQANLVQPRRI